MEGKPFHLSPTSNDVRAIMASKWDSTSSVLYALSILVCTEFELIHFQLFRQPPDLALVNFKRFFASVYQI
jgi:hypothetical protein